MLHNNLLSTNIAASTGNSCRLIEPDLGGRTLGKLFSAVRVDRSGTYLRPSDSKLITYYLKLITESGDEGEHAKNIVTPANPYPQRKGDEGDEGEHVFTGS